MTRLPVDPRQRTEWRRARRRLARQLHPDVGGDLSEYLDAVAALDARFAQAGRPVTVRMTHWLVVRRAVKRRARATGRGVRRLRSRLPRGVPGARRWVQL